MHNQYYYIMVNYTMYKALDPIDLSLVRVLARNSRISVRKLASILKMPHTTVYSRLRRLEEANVIKGYTINIDYRMLGFTVTAVIHVSAQGSYIEELEKILASRHETIAVYDVTGEYDMIVVARFKSIDELDKFIKWVNKLEGVEKTITSIAFRVVKEDLASPLIV